jgi:hypothetical protein
VRLSSRRRHLTVGREVEIGGIRFRGALRTRRCAAINVNPETATRDANLPREIMQYFGHTDLGIYLDDKYDTTLRLKAHAPTRRACKPKPSKTI